jgi:lysophospholipase L1-like esterase
MRKEFSLAEPNNGIDRGGTAMNSLLYAFRTFWRIIFYTYSLAFGYWLIRNLLIGNYFGRIEYFFPVSLFLALLAIGVFFLAFRINHEWFIKINLSLVGTVLVLMISEAGIRVWDRIDPIFRPGHLEDRAIIPKGSGMAYSPYPPGSILMTHGHAGRINNLGFRGSEHPIQKSGNTFRILVLGDSFTFGQGVEESEVYTSVLEKALVARYPKQTVEVINAGVMGYSAGDEMNLLNQIGDLLEPDLILIGFYENDVKDGPQVKKEDRNRWAIPIPENAKDALLSQSKLLMWVSMKYDQVLLIAGIRSDHEASIERAYDLNSEDWKQFVSTYRKIHEWTKMHHIPPPLVGLLLATPYFNPQLNDFINMTPKVEVEVHHVKQVQQVLNNMGIPTVDYLPLFQRNNKQNMMVSKWEGHPNALAHRLYAEGFLNSMTSLNLIH